MGKLIDKILTEIMVSMVEDIKWAKNNNMTLYNKIMESIKKVTGARSKIMSDLKNLSGDEIILREQIFAAMQKELNWPCVFGAAAFTLGKGGELNKKMLQ